MKIEILNQNAAEYEIYPRVARLGAETRFAARGLGIETAWKPGTVCRVKVIPQEQITTAHTHCLGNYSLYETFDVTADGEGYLRFTYTCTREQVYAFRVMEAGDGLAWENGVNLRVFCAADDLYERVPMRGNTHAHACPSVDGHEDPLVAASVYRKAGFDYLAITDHHKIDGSVLAKQAAETLPTEMQLYYGEEVHVPNAYIHAVNVGAVLEGGVGLDRYYHEHEEAVNETVRKTAEEYAPVLPPEIDPEDYAWRKWIADTIHAHGGTAIIAHPFWNYDAHNTQNDMLRYLAETKLFDAVEIVHGQEPDADEANLQAAFWNDLRADGIFLPVVGCDDAHRRSYAWDYDSSFNNAYTVIFAKEPSYDGFREAVCSGYSAAVESYRDAPLHVIATYRLTKYTHFLLQYYFPRHDELCFEEGCRMKDAYLGDREAAETLRAIYGRVARYTDKFFGKC